MGGQGGGTDPWAPDRLLPPWARTHVKIWERVKKKIFLWVFSFQNRYRLILFTCLKACMGGGPGGNPGKAWGAHIGGGSFWALDFWGLLWGCCLCRLGVVDLSLSSVDDSASFTLIAQTNSFRFGLLFSFFKWKGNYTLGGFLKWKKRRRKRRTDVQITLIYPYKKLGLW